MTTSVTVAVHILGKEYKLNCPPEEKDDLLKAAELLDERMKGLKSGGMIGLERIAVMAALNLGYDLLQTRRDVRNGAAGEARIDRLLAQANEELQAFELLAERGRHSP